MKVFTSYYGNVTNLLKNGCVPVGISCFKPGWFNWYNLTYVAPSADLLRRYKNGTTDKDGYIHEFKQMLLNRDAKRFVFNLQKIVEQYGEGYKDVAIICYEKPGQFCHRHLVAEWLEEQCGIRVDEF